MKKVIRLTESDLTRLVRRIIREQSGDSDFPINVIEQGKKRVTIPKNKKRYHTNHDSRAFEKAVRVKNKKTVIDHDLDLSNTDIKSLGNLITVGGNLYLGGTRELTSLGSLESVDGDLYLDFSNIRSLGVLNYVGGDLRLKHTPLSDEMTEEDIRSEVEVGGDIYL
jgi:hypothetical protein